MKQLSEKTPPKKSRPFLVLPLIDAFSRPEENPTMPVKNSGLQLFTKTWPPKRDNKNRLERPLTATLERPMILDIRLVGKIDMSKIRKEFLNISNLCKMPLLMKSKKETKIHRPLSLPPTEKHKKKKKKASDPDDSLEDEESRCVTLSLSAKSTSVKSKPLPNRSDIPRLKQYDANNNKTCKIRRKHYKTVPGTKLDSAKLGGDRSSTKPTVLEACKSCGRKDQPERFHSHPATPAGKIKMDSPKIPVKSTVQKPIAIKYKSKLTTNQPNNDKKPSPIRKSIPSVQKLSPTPPNLVNKVMKSPDPIRTSSGKRTLTCYLCGREFGSASIHLHEPKCLEKWERENASLPPHMRRKPPPKPDSSISKEEWDELAWKSSQSTLTPCHNCGRTFYPDRLIVHQRSCKTPQNNIKPFLAASEPIQMSQNTPSTPTSPRAPPTYECYICGKRFGVNSIKIHERQCLKKWNAENGALPPDKRRPPPVKTGKSKTLEPQPKPPDVSKERPSSARKPPLFPCYICGKLFTVNSIYIHEPQCLRMWKVENDKLPSHKRRPQPLKPDIKFTREGKIDYTSAIEDSWQSHLSQLVPCRNCARTFNPDRVEIHERSCKGA